MSDRQTSCRFLPVATAAALLSLGGCVQAPELDQTVHDHLRDADYPALMDMDNFPSTTVLPGTQAEQAGNALTGRRDTLKNRAQRLHAATLVDADTRTRMQAGTER